MSDMHSEYLSEEAYNQLEKELEFLTTVKRREISGRLEESISQGDLSENAEYQEAKEQQLMLEKKIFELEDLLSRAVVMPKNQKIKERVGLGCVVALKRDLDGLSYEYQIVGSGEANPLVNKISRESPLGISLVDKKKGDRVKVFTPNGEMSYTIIKII